jgi:hypothetical protein
MNVIGHQMTFLDHTVLLLRQAVKYLSQVSSDHPIESFLAVLGGENHVVLTLPCAMVEMIGIH